MQFRNQRLNHKVFNETVAINEPQIQTLKKYKKTHPNKIKGVSGTKL
ncbi:hypothetical protein M33023_05810 [Candidatus Phytoplasma asteris]|uniref:Uncharacterized protein n=1 Tax=Candidatus Phytoplasma asteris TaxID=85620 RepID=A0ABZ2YFN5_9MOLU